MFAVKQQQLLEIIREGRIDEALAFAQSDIAPRVENNVHAHHDAVVIRVTPLTYDSTAQTTRRDRTNHGASSLRSARCKEV